MTITELQEQYIEDLKMDEATIEKRVISLPIMLSKYQYMYYNILNDLSMFKDKIDELYYNIFTEYKKGKSDLSNITVSSTELKRIIESSIAYRELQLKIYYKENDLKLVDEMMQNIKQMSWGIKNYLDFQKLKMGMI